MIKNIQIQNYKGIQNFQLNNLNRINIFMGNNNSGKTSLLEAFYIGIKKNYMASVEVLQFRKLNPSARMMETLFYELNTKNNIQIQIEETNSKVSTTLSLLTEENKFTLPSNFNLNTTIPNQEEKKYLINQEIDGVKINMICKFGYFDNGNGQRNYNVNLELRNPEKNTDNINPKNKSVYYITPKSNINSNFINELKEQIKSRYEKKKIIEELQLFDSKIEDIIIDGLNIELYLKNIDKPLPIQAMGAGSFAILEMASIFARDEIKTVFIDEIEDGLHIESMKGVAKYISKSIDKNSKLQIFMTTHSKEIIQLIDEAQNKKRIVSAYRLYNKNDKTNVIEYTEDLLDTLEEGWEIR